MEGQAGLGVAIGMDADFSVGQGIVFIRKRIYFFMCSYCSLSTDWFHSVLFVEKVVGYQIRLNVT